MKRGKKLKNILIDRELVEARKTRVASEVWRPGWSSEIKGEIPLNEAWNKMDEEKRNLSVPAELGSH